MYKPYQPRHRADRTRRVARSATAVAAAAGVGVATATLAAPAQAASPDDSYTVQAGDTLNKIARAHGTTWREVYQLNDGKISNPRLIYVGQQLNLQAEQSGQSASGSGGDAARRDVDFAGSYTVQPGDTLSKIAPRRGTTWRKLYAANTDVLSNPTRIYVGQVLEAPGSGGGGSQSSSGGEGEAPGGASGGGSASLSSGGTCSNGTSVPSGVSPNVEAVHNDVCASFPGISSYGTFRAGSGDHASGQAIDIMVGGETGWQVAEFVRANASELGVKYVIHAQQIWSVQRSSEGWRSMSDRGGATANHYDHVHVSTY